MKYIVKLLFAIVINSVWAQVPFEGKIVYSVESPTENKLTTMTISFAPYGIRLEAFDSAKQKMEDEIVVIRFDSGKVFTLKPSANSYTTTSLLNSTEEKIIKDSTIAGYTVKPFKYETSGLSTLTGSLYGEPVLHVADDLYYFIPKEYVGNPQLLMVYKNKIVLGIEVSTNRNSRQWNLNSTLFERNNVRHVIKGIAMTVNSGKLDRSLFEIPLTYKCKVQSYSDNERDASDSLKLLIDSTVNNLQFQTINKAKKSSQKKKPTTAKSPLHRKEQ